MAAIIVTILQIISFVFIARAALSWFRLTPGSTLYSLARAIDRLTNPVLRPIRRVLPPIGGFDLSVVAVLLAISFVLIPVATGL